MQNVLSGVAHAVYYTCSLQPKKKKNDAQNVGREARNGKIIIVLYACRLGSVQRIVHISPPFQRADSS